MPPRRSARAEKAGRDASPARAKPAARKAQPRVGRPTPERAAAIEEAILDAASSQFLDVGYEVASMESIAAAAGVSKGTLYARYPTKSALLRAALTLQMEAWTRSHVRTSPLPADPKQRLQQLARGTLAALMAPESRPYQRLAHHAAFNGGREFSSTMYELGMAPAIRDLAEEIRASAEAFPMPLRDPERVARMIQAMLYGWWAQHIALGGVTREDADAYADHCIDVLFYGRAAW